MKNDPKISNSNSRTCVVSNRKPKERCFVQMVSFFVLFIEKPTYHCTLLLNERTTPEYAFDPISPLQQSLYFLRKGLSRENKSKNRKAPQAYILTTFLNEMNLIQQIRLSLPFAIFKRKLLTKIRPLLKSNIAVHEPRRLLHLHH